MTSAREHILQRLRSARATARLPRLDDLPPLEFASATLDECISRFTLEATALGITCHLEATAEAVRQRLTELVDGTRVVSWDPEHLPYDAGRALVALPRWTTGTNREDLAQADVGVTGCDAAIAETASLVMFSAPGRPRSVSLLPPTHIAIVERRQLCMSMAEVFARDAARVRQSAACTIITGPSRTADIELTLTLGIHGPGRVVVIVGP